MVILPSNQHVWMNFILNSGLLFAGEPNELLKFIEGKNIPLNVFNKDDMQKFLKIQGEKSNYILIAREEYVLKHPEIFNDYLQV